MNVRLSDAALGDLTDLRIYLEDSGSPHATAVVARIVAACHRIGALPERGVEWRLSSGRRVRRLLAERHLIVYEVARESVLILRILHAHRDIRDIFRLDEPDDD